MRVPTPGCDSTENSPPIASARSLMVCNPKCGQPVRTGWATSNPRPSSATSIRSLPSSTLTLRLSVLPDVGQRLLDDAHELDLDRSRQRQRGCRVADLETWRCPGEAPVVIHAAA